MYNTSSHALDFCTEIVIIIITSSINKLLARVGVRIVKITKQVCSASPCSTWKETVYKTKL